MHSENSFSRRGFIAGAGAVAAAAFGGNALAAEPEAYDYEADVVVLGSGSGLMAACEAAADGAEVILMEKAFSLGGNTGKSAGEFLVAGSSVQRDAGIEDSPEAMMELWRMAYGGMGVVEFGDEGLADYLYKTMPEAMDRAIEFGLEFALARRAEEALPVRTHYVQPNAYAWVSGLADKAEELGVTIMTETPGVSLIKDESGRVAGVAGLDRDGNPIAVKARKAVILATGDACNNTRLKSKFTSAKMAAVPGATLSNEGDGLFMAMAAGADSGWRNMCIISWSMLDNLTQLETPIVAKGTIFVNKEGRRFANEYALNPMAPELASCQMEQTDRTGIAIFGEGVAEFVRTPANYQEEFEAGKVFSIATAPGDGVAFLEDYEKDGILYTDDTLEGLAGQLGIPADALVQTVEKWNAAVEAGVDDEFGRTIGEVVSGGVSFGSTVPIEAPYYALVSSNPVTMDCEGPSVVVDSQMRVVDVAGEPIPGLYAMGGGMLSGAPVFSLMGGAHLALGLVSGYIAGRCAAAE